MKVRTIPPTFKLKIMRRICILFALILSAKLNAQRYMDYDTIHRNEFSGSFQPLITLFMGVNDNSNLANMQLGYRHYFKKKLVLRTTLVLFPTPNNGYNNNSSTYDRTVNGVNVFRTQNYGGGMKSQLNVGLEKIFKVNRLMHGFGADVFVNQQFKTYDQTYYQDSLVSYPSQNYAAQSKLNTVDSLGSSYRGNQVGVGLQLFYSLRYRMSKHWYLSATVGPSVIFSSFNGRFYNRATQKELPMRNFDFNIPAMPLISDISICYRF
jgi:hypothetical protein